MSAPFHSDDVARQLDYCSYCPKMCRHACPVSTASGRETWIPQAKMDRLNWLRRGQLPWTTENTDPLWACTGCRHCTSYCDHGNEPGLVLLAGRAAAVARGVGHPALEGYGDRFRARDERLVARAHEAFDADRFAEDGQVGFWPGCDAVDKGAADVAAALAVFDKVGLGHVRLVDAPQSCAGYPLLAAGYPDLFRWHAGKVAASLRRFKTVVINCSACLYTLRAQYPAEGVSLPTEILSLAELMAQASAQIPRPTTRKTVYYHDPCHHARYTQVIEPPRRVLEQVADVRELAWSKGDTECCGGAGLLPKTMPTTADAMARRRLAEVAAQGGGMVVTSCATCTFMLRRNAPAGVEVADLPTAVAELTGTPFMLPALADDEP
ncbi:MAG: (Fe-S)-binding protein [Kofleriaceae bacterium]|nr:(Fe-S)-binding protein [Myxococcales bacterium]MCB9559221.1 (Fe-S)-binding protein [Kofleriaceae bacterium]MCB9574887.1 (Fe-S)-binding protein [Kofleriaceae bacterium]